MPAKRSSRANNRTLLAGKTATLETELATARADLERASTAHDSLLQSHKALKQAEEKLREELSTLTSASTSSDEVAALQASLAALQDTDNARQKEMEALRSELHQVETAKQASEQELAACRGEVEETSATLSAAMAELDSTKDEVTELEKVIDDLRAEVKSVSDARAQLEQERGELADTLSAVREAAEQATSSKSVLEQELSSLRTELEDTSSRPSATERDQIEVEALRQELETQRERFAETSRALADLRDLHAQAQTELEHLRARTDSTTAAALDANASSRDDHSDESDSLRLQISEAQAKIRQLEQDVFTLESTRVKMLKANGDLKSQVESMMDALAQERAKARRLLQEEEEAASSPREEVALPPLFSPPRNGAANRSVAPMDSSSVPSRPPLTPTRRGHSHRRTASTLPSVSEVSDTSSQGTATGYHVDDDQTAAGTSAQGENELEPLTPLGSPPLMSAIKAGSASAPVTPMPPRSGFTTTPEPSTTAANTTSRDGGRDSHVRHASLSLLKARMEDEYGVPYLNKAGPLSPVRDGPSSAVESGGTRTKRVPLSRDLVWCAACEGDLFVV